MFRAYCDESYDSGNRVYAVAGFVGKDKTWKKVSRNWRNRCLRDQIECYHAADCESRLNDHSHLSVARSIALNTDLIASLDGAPISGFGIAIYLEDYETVARSSAKAARLLKQSPYFLAMQFLVVDLCCTISEHAPAPVAFIFEQQDEFSGKSQDLYEQVRKKNPTAATCMGTLTYAPAEKFIPLQIADKLVYEVMKAALNSRYDSTRPERKSLTAMKESRIINTLRYLDALTLENLVAAQPSA